MKSLQKLVIFQILNVARIMMPAISWNLTKRCKFCKTIVNINDLKITKFLI